MVFCVGYVQDPLPAAEPASIGTPKDEKPAAEKFSLPPVEKLGVDLPTSADQQTASGERPESEPIRPQATSLRPAQQGANSDPGSLASPLLPPLNPRNWIPMVGPIPGDPRNLILPLHTLTPANSLALPPLDAWLKSAALNPAPLRIRVSGFRYQGNTIFTDAELDMVLRPFLAIGKLSIDDLEEARDALTKHYVDHDYATSGALLPDQRVNNGIVVFRIIEGKFTKIEWRGRGRLRESWLNRQIAPALEGVPNMKRLRDQLQLLQRQPNIGRIAAKVRPDLNPGDAWLDLDITRQGGLYGGIEAHNRRPPSVGAEQIEAWLGHSNVTGNGDVIEVRSGLLREGWDEPELSRGSNLAARYGIELPWWRTQVSLEWQSESFAVIEEPFTPIDVGGLSRTARASVLWPLVRSLEQTLFAGMILDYRDSQTDVLGIPFSLTPGAIDGKTELWAARFFQEYVSRGRKHVLAARNTLSMGFDGTDDGTDRDADFLSWNLNGQWVRRLGETDAQFIMRGGGQWSSDPLLALEQIAVGGANTVRGYRENQLVRDWGGFVSAELRLPLWKSRSGNWALYLAPFVDAGGGLLLEEEKDEWAPGHFDWIASAGAGVLLRLSRFCEAQIFWGHPLRQLEDDFDGDNLQDKGIHFSLRIQWN